MNLLKLWNTVKLEYKISPTLPSEYKSRYALRNVNDMVYYTLDLEANEKERLTNIVVNAFKSINPLP